MANADSAPPAPGPIVALAPTRICLAGGGTDLDPYAERYQGAVLNVAIDRLIRVTLTRRPDRLVLIRALGERRHIDLCATIVLGEDRSFDLIRAIVAHHQDRLVAGFSLHVDSDVPDGSGLGSSGAVAVATLAAIGHLLGDPLDRDAIAWTAFQIETQTLAWAGGKQDQWSAAHGGLRLTRFGPGQQVAADAVKCDAAQLRAFHSWLLLVHIGGQRQSARLQVALREGMTGSETKLAALHELKTVAIEARAALERGDYRLLGELVDRGWRAKKRSNPMVSNERIDAIYRALRAAGALGGKLIGAGGAGYMVLLCPPDARGSVVQEMARLGVSPVEVNFHDQGVTVRGPAMTLGPFDALVFDLDGTLLDAEALHCAAWCHVTADLPVPFCEQTFASFAGQGDLAIAEHVAHNNPDSDPAELLAGKRRHFGAHQDGLPLMPGALALLERAHGAGFKLALATISPAAETWRAVRRHGLERFLSAVVHRESAMPHRPDGVMRAKPEPDIYQTAAALLGVAPGRCCALEDTRTGLLAAKAAGMAAVVIPTVWSEQSDLARADAVAESLHAVSVHEGGGLIIGGSRQQGRNEESS